MAVPSKSLWLLYLFCQLYLKAIQHDICEIHSTKCKIVYFPTCSWRICRKFTRSQADMHSSTEKQFMLRQNNQICQYNTRNRNNMCISRTNHMFSSKCLRHNILYIISATHQCILNKIYTHSIQLFTKNVKLLYINEYSDTCSTVNCYICKKSEFMPSFDFNTT